MEKTAHTLKIVGGTETRSKPRVADANAQTSLFPFQNSRCVFVVSLPDTSEQEFLTVLVHSSPAVVIDLRPAPRFDIGRLNRQIIFQTFKSNSNAYIDLFLPEDRSCEHNQFLSKLKMVLSEYTRQERPLMVLMSSGQEQSKALIPPLMKLLGELHLGWDVYHLPKCIHSVPAC